MLIRERSSVVEHNLAKVAMRVRFPSLAPLRLKLPPFLCPLGYDRNGGFYMKYTLKEKLRFVKLPYQFMKSKENMVFVQMH